MLYWLLYEQLYRYFSPLRVFRFITFRTAFASLTALFLCLVLGPWLIAKLRQFQIGQIIREEGPKSHQKKAGTPTMGGVLIVISIVVPTLLVGEPRQRLRLDRDVQHRGLRRDRLLGRLLQSPQAPQPGAHGAAQVRRAVRGGVDRGRLPAGTARARGLLDGHERALLQELQAQPGHRRPARQPVHLRLRVSSSSSCLSRSSWSAARTP